MQKTWNERVRRSLGEVWLDICVVITVQTVQLFSLKVISNVLNQEDKNSNGHGISVELDENNFFTHNNCVDLPADPESTAHKMRSMNRITVLEN